MPVFTPHQNEALAKVAAWIKAKPGEGAAPPVFRLFGYAGTGKTTLAKHIAEGVDGKVLFAAFTGKAALVMRSKGCHGASTIHSLIYRARESGEETPSFDLWSDSPAAKAKLIVIDECSMVDAELGRDLLTFGAPVLVLGDPAQLPPVAGGGFFTDAEPDAMLTEVHRQAQDDPIVRLSMDVREGRRLAPGTYGETEVVRRDELDPARVIGADQVLVGRNATRRAYNERMRQRRGFETAAAPGGQAGLPAQQPAQGPVQRRPVGGEGEARAQIRDADLAARLRRGDGRPARQGVGAAGMLLGRHRGARVAAAQALRRVRLRLCADRAQGARGRNGTTSCCSTSCSPSRTAASAGSTPASRAPRSA